MQQASLELVLDWVRSHPLPGGRIISCCLWGESGVGKTAWVRGYCRQRDIGFRGYHPAHDKSGSDIVGLAMLDEQLGRTVYARPMWLPSEHDQVVFERRGLIFIDEINRGDKNVLHGLLEPVGEGTIAHSGWQMPSQWSFICAANPPQKEYSVNTLDQAMMDRLLHLPMGFDAIRWSAWADEAEIHPDFRTFVAQYPELMAGANTELPPELDISPSPRTIEYLARLYEPGMDKVLLRTLGIGLIGPQSTSAFFSHLEDEMRPIAAEQVFSGAWAESLTAIRAAGRDDLLDASETLVLAALIRYQANAAKAGEVAAFAQALGQERYGSFWQQILLQAPSWAREIHGLKRA